MNINNFYRYNLALIENLPEFIEGNTFQANMDIMSTFKVGDGLVLANWNDNTYKGEVSFIGIVVGGIDNETKKIPVVWLEKSFELLPNSSGYQYWRKDFFKFAAAPTKRYGLKQHFEELNNFDDNGGITKPPSSNSSGYVYIIESEYGYKIGKTKSLKNRSQLFGVKMPFDFSFIYTFFSEKFSTLEVDLHCKFANKRINGEWFQLTKDELQEIESFCKSYQCKFKQNMTQVKG